MDIILHLGAHRTATTTFQSFLLRNRQALGQAGMAIWTPAQTRSGPCQGLIDGDGDARGINPRRNRTIGLIGIETGRLQEEQVQQLVVSDAALIGNLRGNLHDGSLYPQLAPRLEQIRCAFGDATIRIGLSVRAYDAFWASALGRAIGQGEAMPGAARLDHLVTQPRRWRDMIGDIAATFPRAEIVILPYERFAGQPEAQLAQLTGRINLPRLTGLRDWQNAGPRLDKLRRLLRLRGDDDIAARLPDGTDRWMPFDRDQQVALRAQYTADLDWLAGGASGLARLAGQTRRTTQENIGGQEAGAMPPVPPLTKGQGIWATA